MQPASLKKAVAGLFADQTYLGILSILIWAGTVAISRRLTAELGTWTASALIYTAAGILACLVAAFTPGRLAGMLRLPRRYLWGCGGLFVLYMVSLYLAIGMAANPAQVVVVGLINYLWPGLSLVFAVPLLGHKARPFLPLGILVSLGGVALASWQPGAPLADLLTPAALVPDLLALTAAVCWGLYSTLSRRWAAENTRGAVPLFLLASGLVLSLGRAVNPETSHWSLPVGFALAYMIVFPAMLAYDFWDSAVRRGRMILLASLSYFIPLLSTVITVTLLGVPAQPTLWLAALLVFAGAVVCKGSMVE